MEEQKKYCEELTAERMLSVTYDMTLWPSLPDTEKVKLYRQLFTTEDIDRIKCPTLKRKPKRR
jgi:hypothetical protein